MDIENLEQKVNDLELRLLALAELTWQATTALQDQVDDLNVVVSSEFREAYKQYKTGE